MAPRVSPVLSDSQLATLARHGSIGSMTPARAIRPAVRLAPIALLVVAGVGSCGGDDRPDAGASGRHPAVALSLTRSEGGPHARFTGKITSRRETGTKGKRRTAYMLAARALRPRSGCVNDRFTFFPEAPEGTRVKATLDPARGKGGYLGWCRGTFRGRVTYSEGYACPSDGRCVVPRRFPRVRQVVGRFTFRVK